MRILFLTLALCLLPATAVEAGTKQPVLIVSASTGNADIFVIDPETGNTRNLTSNPAADTMPAWSPAGNQIAFSSDRAGGVNLFVMDLAGNVRQLTREKPGAQCTNAAWSPDGKRIAYHCRQGAASEVRSINVDGSEHKVLVKDGWEPAWSPDGRRIAFGSSSGGQGFHLCVMDADGSHVRQLSPPAGNRLGLVQPAWSPDGRCIVYTDSAGSLELFIIDADGNNRRQLTWAGGLNTFAAWGPDAGSQVTFVHVNEKTGVYAQIDRAGTQLGLSPLAGFPFREVPVKMGRPAWRAAPTPAPRGGGSENIAGGQERKCVCVGRLNCGHGPLNRAVFAPDGKMLATAHNDGSLGLCECRDGALRPVHVLNGHIDCVWGCAWSPDGKTLASGSRDRTVCLWDVDHGGLRVALDDHKAPVPALAYAPDGKTLVTGSLDRCIKVRNAGDGKPYYEVVLPGDRLQELAALAISPNGQVLVAGGGIWTIPAKGILAAWDLPTGQPLWSLAGDLAGVWCLAFAPDGKSLALACLDGTIRLCDPVTGRTLSVFRGHQDRVIGVAFTPDGKTLASCGQDNTIRLWDVATGRQVAQRGALGVGEVPGHVLGLEDDGVGRGRRQRHPVATGELNSCLQRWPDSHGS